MQIDLSTQLPCSLAEVVAQVRTPRLLRQVASPLLSFSPLTPAEFPSTWSEGTYWVELKLLGLLPIGRKRSFQDVLPSWKISTYSDLTFI